MKRVLLGILASTALVGFAPASGLAQNMNQRQSMLESRIDAGVRQGSLTQAEAAQLRREFDAIARTEAGYRASGRGLTAAERADLDRRFDLLSSRIRVERHDAQDRGDMNVNARQRDLAARIDAGVRDRSLTRAEAVQLRREFDAIAAIERQYRTDGRGLSAAERAYLDRRFDLLERRLGRERADDDRRWSNLDRRQAAFDRQLDQAVRDHRVSPREAQMLRADFRQIARLERQYRRSPPGITSRERADLNARFYRMESNFRASMTPADNLFDVLLGLID